MKSGTTSLHYYLRQHPSIHMPAMKETNFFAPPEDVPYYRGTKLIPTLDRYERLFNAAFAARGEASPSYTEYPRRKHVPERIKHAVPDAKLIYLVRDPIARIVSHYKHRVAVENERRSISEALHDLADPYSPYICPSFYASQLTRYLPHFPLESILVVDHADLFAHRQGTLREIFAFLEVNDSFSSPQFDEEMNTGKELRSYSEFVVLLQSARTSPLQRLPRGLRVRLRRGVERVVSRPLMTQTLSDDLRSRLHDLYAQDAMRLREMTGKTFSTWRV